MVTRGHSWLLVVTGEMLLQELSCEILSTTAIIKVHVHSKMREISNDETPSDFKIIKYFLTQSAIKIKNF